MSSRDRIPLALEFCCFPGGGNAPTISAQARVGSLRWSLPQRMLWVRLDGALLYLSDDRIRSPKYVCGLRLEILEAHKNLTCPIPHSS